MHSFIHYLCIMSIPKSILAPSDSTSVITPAWKISAYYFPIIAVTNYYKFSILNDTYLVSHIFRGSEIQA